MSRIQKGRDDMKNAQQCIALEFLKCKRSTSSCAGFIIQPGHGGQIPSFKGDGQFVVDKDGDSCSCTKWRLTGVPSCHAVSVIYYNNIRPKSYIMIEAH